MSALEIFGSTEATPQGTRKRWQQGGGESQLFTWNGPTAAIESLYNGFVAAAAIDPTYVVMDYDPGKGLGTLTIQKTDPEVVIGTSTENGITTIYELLSNEFLKPIHTHPYFSEDSPVLTAAQINAVYAAYDSRSESTSFTGKQGELFDLLSKGTEEYFVNGYVLRESKMVNGRNAVRANFTDVNRVSTPPTTASANTLIGDLADRYGEWLKKPPVVRQITKAKWHIETEWWWASKWSAILYGGTGSP